MQDIVPTSISTVPTIVLLYYHHPSANRQVAGMHIATFRKCLNPRKAFSLFWRQLLQQYLIISRESSCLNYFNYCNYCLHFPSEDTKNACHYYNTLIQEHQSSLYPDYRYLNIQLKSILSIKIYDTKQVSYK